MATAKQGQVIKIYDLRTLGYDQIHTQLQQVSKDFDAIRKAKQAATEGLANAKDKDAIAQYTSELNELKLKEQELRVQRQAMINEAKAAQIIQQQEQQNLKAQQKGAQAAAGSYQALYNQYKQLYALVKATPTGQVINFQGQVLQFDQAIAKLKELAAAEQDFRRQFARDGLLVAEYTSGIIQAFQKADLGDLVGGQLTKAETALNGINAEFEQLKNEFNQAKQTGVGDLNSIEAKMIENRKEAVNLTSQITVFKDNLKGAGGIGDSVTKAISSGFKNIKEQLGGFVLAFVGIQTVLTKLESFGELANEEFQQMETSTARLKGSLQNLGRSNELEGLEKNVEALGQRFRFLDDNDIRNATNSLVLFGKLSEAQIKQILPVIVDFATQQHKTLDESTTLFIKAIEGQDRPLKQFGLSLKEAGSEEGKFAVLTDELGKKLAGTADTFDKSTSGAQARNRQEWKNLAEEIGTKVIPVLTAIGGVVVNVAAALFSIPFPILIAGITAVTAALTLYKAEQIRTYVVTQIATKQGLIYNAYLLAQAIAQRTVAVATRLATAEIVLFNGAIRISPIGIFLTLLGLIIPAVALFANRLKEAKTQQTALQEVNAKANVIYAEQTAKLNSLVAIIKSSATSDDTKKKTLQQLTEAHKEYSSVLKNNTIDVVELDRVTKQLTDSIRLQAETTASAQLLAEKSAKVVEVQSARQLIESAIATGQKDLTADLSKAQQEIIKSFGSAKSQLLPTSQGGIKLFEGTFGGGVPLDPKQVLASLKKLEDERITGVQQFQKINDKAQKDLDAYLKSQATSTAGFEVDIKTLRTKIETLDKEIQDFQGSKADLAAKKKERDALQKQLDELTKTTPTKAAGPSQLSAEVKDSLKDVEAIRDELLAKEELRRQQNLEDEEAYLKNVLLINEVAIDKKLGLIKGENAEERKTIAQLNLEKLKLIQETNDKIFDIQQKALKEQLDQQIAAIELQRDEQLLDPNLTETQRADIKLAADRKILDLQVAYNDAINRLEKQLAQQSLANTKEGAEAIKKTKQAILLDEKAQTEAALKDEQIAGERSVVEFKNLISKLKLAIVQDTELSPQRRTQLLTVAQGQENIGILAREVDSLQKQLPIYKQLLAEKVITDQQYQEFETQLNQKQLELNDALVKGIAGNIDQVKKFYKDLLDAGLLTKEAYDKLIGDLNNTTSKGVQKATQSIKSLKDILTTGIANLFNIDTSTDKGKLLSGAIAEALVKTYQLATTAMTNYYNAERERIQQNLQLQEDRLDKEKEQVEARAQSQAEIDSIEKQYAAKKKKAQQQAGEDLKRTKRSEAKIALASELINIAVQASQYPFPASLIIGGILAAAALANYSIQIGAINREQFKWGGMPGQKQKGASTKGPASFIKRIFSLGGQPGSSGGGRRQATVIKFDKGGQPAGSKKLEGITSSHPIIAATTPAFVPATAMTTATEYPAPYVKQKNVVREIWTGIQRIFKLGGQPGKTKAKDSRESSLHTIEQTTRRNLNDDTAVHRVVSIEDGTPIDETTELPSPADKKQTFIQRVFTRIRKFAFGGQPGKQVKDSKQETSQRLINETTQITRDNKLKETNSTDISSRTHANTDSSSAASTNKSSSTSREEKADSTLAVNTHITRDNDISETNRSQKSTSAEETHKRKKNYLRERIITSVQKFFSFGGRPGEVPIRGGEFGGRPHSQGGTDFEFEGNRYNAEAKEVAVIRTRNAPINKIYQIIGTQMQIASAANRIGGGVDFRPGAKIKHFATGGVLGSNLQAPIYVPSSSGQASNDAIVKELKSIQAKLEQNTTVHRQLADEQSRRVDDIEVNVVVGKVTKAQKEASIKSTIGTLS